MRLENKVILITASTRGIGLACVKACAKEGAIVYMAARNLETAEKTANELNAQGYRVKYVYNDAGKPDTFLSMIDEVVKNEGRLDVLVNNFGVSNLQKDLDFSNTNINDYLDIVTLNLRSVFMASQAATKYMAKQGGGSIVNISSIGGLVPDISQVAYGSSKAAINYLTKLIAVHEATHHIRCNAVLPGMTATEAVKNHLSEDFRNLFLRHIPLKKIGLPAEIAAAVVYFASDESAYTTGQILAVSGGFGLATPIYGDVTDTNASRS
ncbi:MAG: SDR family oxidoreductase [Lachnospiraceae bacterium]|nr:SDR family oxidoreductase [Lachnospiraceae bacterium]